MGIRDSAGTNHVVACDWKNARSAGWTFTNGANPIGYVNGNRSAVAGAAGSFTAPGAGVDLAIAGNLAGGSAFGYWLNAVVMFNTQLTGAEISQLHNDFMESAYYL
jgi:hypothetical protein